MAACCGPPALPEQPCFHAGACCSPHPQLGRHVEADATPVRVLAVTQSPLGVPARKTELEPAPPSSVGVDDADVTVKVATEGAHLSGTHSNRPKVPPKEIPSDARSSGGGPMIVMNRFPTHRTASGDSKPHDADALVESRCVSGSSASRLSPSHFSKTNKFSTTGMFRVPICARVFVCQWRNDLDYLGFALVVAFLLLCGVVRSRPFRPCI
jgi:hypothetical protein